MTCCLLLCQVCEELIREFGLYGAEKRLKLDPGLWIPRLFEAEKGPLLVVYDLLADALMETALYYFRERIENAYQSKSYAGTSQARRLDGQGCRGDAQCGASDAEELAYAGIDRAVVGR